MLKFIKHNIDTIEGIEIYPLISLLLFFTVFVTMLYFVYKMPKNNIDEISQLPLDNNNNIKETSNE